MDATQFSAAASHMIDSMEDHLRHAIDIYRDGGERLGQAARQRWDAALEKSSPQLSMETLRNAQRAQAYFAGCYTRGVESSATHAQAVLDGAVKLVRTAVERAQGRPQARA